MIIHMPSVESIGLATRAKDALAINRRDQAGGSCAVG
jgi:hypothetical protein